MKLTKSVIDGTRYEFNEGKRQVVWDSELQGFGLRVYPSGKKSFVLSYRNLGRKHLMSLGHYGVMTLDQARKEARIKLGQVAQGNNPIAERRASQNAKT